MAVLALGSLAKAAGSAQGSVGRVENQARRQSEAPGSGCGACNGGLPPVPPAHPTAPGWVWVCPLAHTLWMRKRGTTATVTFPVPQPQVCFFWRLQEFLQVLHCLPGQSQIQGSTWVLPHLCSHSFTSCQAGARAAGNWHSCNGAVLGPGLTLKV